MSELATQVVDGDRRALARAITLVENDTPEGWELVREVFPHTGRASLLGFTGPPGVVEIPDVIVVNKADHPLTDTMVREIKAVLALGPRESWQVPVLRTEAVRGEGIEELVKALADHRAHLEAEGTLSARRRRNLRNEVLAIATYRLRRELEQSIADDLRVQDLLEQVVARRLDPASAAGEILRMRT